MPPSPRDRSRSPASSTGRSSSGDEAARAVQEVLKDQAERRERQRNTGPDKKKHLLPLPVVALIWGAACLFVWAATPQFLLPEPLPKPTSTQVEAGLRMDMISVVTSIESFRGQTGRMPDSLGAVVADPPSGIRYVRLSNDSYRITGQRNGQEITYESGDSMKSLVGDIRERIRGREAAGS